jgi:8-oxo-dGTP diphosphatase
MDGGIPPGCSARGENPWDDVVWVVAAAIVDDLRRPRRLLAARRTEPEHLAGGWELPGGKIDPGESPVVALHREVAEELGVEVELGPELAGPQAAGSGLPGWPLSPPYRMRVWLARVVRGEPAAIEDHDAVVWLEPGQWSELEWLPSNRSVVAALELTVAAADTG